MEHGTEREQGGGRGERDEVNRGQSGLQCFLALDPVPEENADHLYVYVHGESYHRVACM